MVPLGSHKIPEPPPLHSQYLLSVLIFFFLFSSCDYGREGRGVFAPDEKMGKSLAILQCAGTGRVNSHLHS